MQNADRDSKPGVGARNVGPIRCPWCAEFNAKVEALLGKLGSLTHYRCRSCGGQWSKGAAHEVHPSSRPRLDFVNHRGE